MVQPVGQPPHPIADFELRIARWTSPRRRKQKTNRKDLKDPKGPGVFFEVFAVQSFELPQVQNAFWGITGMAV